MECLGRWIDLLNRISIGIRFAISRPRGAPRFAAPSRRGRQRDEFPKGRTLLRVPRDQIDGVIQVTRLEDHDAAELLPCFRQRSVGNNDLSIRVLQRHRRARRLQRFPSREVTVRAELVVIREAAVHHRMLFVFQDGSERVGINITEADVFHGGGLAGGTGSRHRSSASRSPGAVFDTLWKNRQPIWSSRFSATVFWSRIPRRQPTACA